jgi:hypothetical protein
MSNKEVDNSSKETKCEDIFTLKIFRGTINDA